MTIFDKFLTNKLWFIAIIILIIGYCIKITGEPTKVITASIAIIIVLGFVLMVWYFSKYKIKATIYWKNGNITTSGPFNGLTDYEDWLDDYLEINDDLIDDIVINYEYQEW